MDIEGRLADLERQLGELDRRVAGLTGPHLEVSAGAVDITGAVVEGPHTEVVIAEGPPPGQSVAEWVSGITGSPGIVVDPGVARDTPCIKLELGNGARPLVYSKGIIGALDEEQQALYCGQGYVEHPASERQRARLTAMRRAAETCRVEAKGADTGQHLSNYFSCLGRELRTQGVEP